MADNRQATNCRAIAHLPQPGVMLTGSFERGGAMLQCLATAPGIPAVRMESVSGGFQHRTAQPDRGRPARAPASSEPGCDPPPCRFPSSRPRRAGRVATSRAPACASFSLRLAEPGHVVTMTAAGQGGGAGGVEPVAGTEVFGQLGCGCTAPRKRGERPWRSASGPNRVPPGHGNRQRLANPFPGRRRRTSSAQTLAALQ